MKICVDCANGTKVVQSLIPLAGEVCDAAVRVAAPPFYHTLGLREIHPDHARIGA